MLLIDIYEGCESSPLFGIHPPPPPVGGTDISIDMDMDEIPEQAGDLEAETREESLDLLSSGSWTLSRQGNNSKPARDCVCFSDNTRKCSCFLR